MNANTQLRVYDFPLVHRVLEEQGKLWWPS